MTRKAASAGLLDPDDPPPFTARNCRGDARGVLVICDHASRLLPRKLGTLGLPARRLEEHIGHDIGAAGVARCLADELDAGFVFGGYSRLAVDLNRSTRDASVVPAISDGVLVPGNLSLSAAARAERIAALHTPYHAAIARLIETQQATGVPPVLVAIHSFTPAISSVPRPWHVGVLWDKDARLAIPLLAALRAERDLIVGDNEPYSGRHPADYSIDHHAEGGGLVHAAIEIRQDLISTEPEQRAWGARLARLLRATLDGTALRAARPAERA
jgi:predicted N-formylglutamate amidohydrolase